MAEVKVDITANTQQATNNVNSFTDAFKKNKAAILAVGAALALVINEAAQFEKQMADIGNLLGEMSTKQLPALSQGIRRMQIEFGEASSTLQKGLFDIISAGIEADKALAVLEVSAKAAAAGVTDTGVAADAVTTFLNAFKLEAEEATRVANVLFVTALKGKTSFGELAPAVGQVAATAALAGVQLEIVGAALSTITRAGISTNETVTALNQVIVSFLKPTTDAVKAAKEFGLEMNTASLKGDGLINVMEKLKTASAEQIASIFPNVRALKGFAALLGDATGFADDYATALSDVDFVQEAFNKQMETSIKQWDVAIQQIKVLAAAFGDILLPVVTSLLDPFVSLAKTLSEISISIRDIDFSKLLSLGVTPGGQGRRRRGGAGGGFGRDFGSVGDVTKQIGGGIGIPGFAPGGVPFNFGRLGGFRGQQGEVGAGFNIPFGENFQSVNDKFKELDLILEGFDPNLLKTTERLTFFQDAFTMGIQDTFDTIITGTFNFGQVFTTLWRSILNELFSETARQAGSALGGIVFRAIGGALGGAIGGPAGAAIGVAGGGGNGGVGFRGFNPSGGRSIVIQTMDAKSFDNFFDNEKASIALNRIDNVIELGGL